MPSTLTRCGGGGTACLTCIALGNLVYDEQSPASHTFTTPQNHHCNIPGPRMNRKEYERLGTITNLVSAGL
jgi:hypothetical protein